MRTQNIQINNIIKESYVDGPGRRTVLFMQGCPLACPGCQSKHTWSPDGKNSRTVAELAHILTELSTEHGNVTISGGEAFFQPTALAELVYRLKNSPSVKHILLYTGYTWEQLFDPCHPAYPYLKLILSCIDVLVDGPFIRSEDDPTVTYRGSRNQRPIDVQETFLAGEVVVLDWDNEVIVTETGEIYLPVGFASEFEAIGAVEKTRRCGQSV